MPASRHLHYILLLFSIYILSACGNARYLAEGQTLYTGAEVKIEDSVMTKAQKKALAGELESYVRPVPNSSFFGIKYRLWFWNIAGEPKSNKGIRSWIRNKLGEPPVIAEDVRLEMNNLVLENQLFNQGYFNATSDGEKVTKKKKTKAVFTVFPATQYRYKSISILEEDSSIIANAIRSKNDETILKIGNPYNLEIIKGERERISRFLNDNGYYFFNADYLISYVDTVNDSVNLKLELKKKEMPQAAYFPFKINSITVLPNYRFVTTTNANANRRQATSADTLKFENFTVVDRRKAIREIVYDQSIIYRQGDLYSESKQNKTLSRLVGTNLFKFIKNDYNVVRSSSSMTGSLFDITYNTLLQRGILVEKDPKLDLVYSLTQYPRKKIDVGIGGYTLNDARYGTRLDFIWRNRNIFKGAELLSVKGGGTFELQYGGENRRPNTYNLGLETTLDIPRFLVPFKLKKTSNAFLPKTIINAKYDYFLRTGLYRIHSISTGIGYIWKENISKEHKLHPMNITFVRTDTFSQSASTDVNFRNILFKGVIIGPTYEFTYNSQVGAIKPTNFYFNGLADFSGNILGLIQQADYEDNLQKIFGNPYAQYVKFQTDFRVYHKLNKSQNLAARLFLGYGIPYGNSRNLPNIKQFFAGGISSIRGFNARMLGPGSFHERTLRGTSTYIEMLGDIKLETNLEYRAQLYRFIHGAVFVDAGNIWLARENPDFPGGQISKDFLKEIAVAGGFGIRLDFSVIMLRLDFGFPLRKPWLPEGDRWTFNKIDFKNPEWRQENIVFGFAIGYPF